LIRGTNRRLASSIEMAPSVAEIQSVTTDPIEAAKQNLKTQEAAPAAEVADKVCSIWLIVSQMSLRSHVVFRALLTHFTTHTSTPTRSSPLRNSLVCALFLLFCFYLLILSLIYRALRSWSSRRPQEAPSPHPKCQDEQHQPIPWYRSHWCPDLSVE
jgi:hypothetical protein